MSLMNMNSFDFDPFTAGFPMANFTGAGNRTATRFPGGPNTSILGDVKWSMGMDVIDAEDCYLVMAELPGVGKDNVNIAIESNILTIRCDKQQTAELPTSFHYDIDEICYGKDVRKVRLPLNVDQDSAKTCYKDGMLCVTFQKFSQHAQGPKKLEIQSS